MNVGPLLSNRYILSLAIFTLLAGLVVKSTSDAELLADTNAINSLKIADTLIKPDAENAGRSNASDFRQAAGYPFVISWLAQLSPEFRAAITCHAEPHSCENGKFTLLIRIQYLLAIVGLLAIFATAYVLTQSWAVAILTLVFAFMAGSYGTYAGQVSPLVWINALVATGLLALALAANRGWRSSTLVSGIAFAAAAALQPQLFFVAAITVLFIWLAGDRLYPTLQNSKSHAVAFAAGFGLCAACLYLLSQAGTLGVALLDHSNFKFSERAQLSNLDAQHQLGLLLTPIPILGGLFEWAFGLPGPMAIEDAAAMANTTASVGAHALATPGILLRGLYCGTPILTLLGLLHIYPLFEFSREDARLGPVVLVAAPIIATVLVNALLSGNRPEHNPGLVFLLTFATAYLVGRTEIRRNFWRDYSANLPANERYSADR